MPTTTAITPMNERTMANGPSLWPRTAVLPLKAVVVCVVLVRGPLPAADERTAGLAGVTPTPTIIHSNDALETMRMLATRRVGSLQRLRRGTRSDSGCSAHRIEILRLVRIPALAQQRVRVDVTLDLVDALPSAQECLLGETGKRRRAL
jgi:hypothetical protein